MKLHQTAWSTYETKMPSPVSPDQLLNALPRSWAGRSGFVLVFLLAWFALQFPLVPTTALGFTVNIAFALAVLGYAAFAVRSIIRLNSTGLDRNVKSAVGFILAASVGVAIFVAAYFSRDFLSTNFGYHHIRELIR